MTRATHISPPAATAGRDSGLLGLISATLLALLGLALFALQFLYFGYFWSRDGQSIGMRWFNVRVVRQDGDGLSFLRAALRGSAGYYISGLIFGLGFLWALWDRNSEAWHDKLFDTWVIAAR